MNLSQVKSLTIPEGVVKQITVGDTVLWKSRLLPAGYTQLEYIQNTSGALLDTGVMPSADMIFETKIDVDTTKFSDEYFSSCRIDSGSTRYYCLNFNSGQGFVCSNANWPGAKVLKSGVAAPYVIKSHIESTKVTITVNDVTNTVDMVQQEIPDKTLPLYGAKLATSNPTPSIARINYPIKCYYARYISNGVLVADLVPCRRDSDGKVGMYDLISGEFKSSMTTNEFIGSDDTQALSMTATMTYEPETFNIQNEDDTINMERL